jgi:murein DD-endopeptidase MepM/ murein hydrolase activator NlpD
MKRKKLPFIIRQTPNGISGKKSELSKNRITFLKFFIYIFLFSFAMGSIALFNFSTLQFRLYKANAQDLQMSKRVNNLKKSTSGLDSTITSLFLSENRARVKYGLIPIDSSIQQMGVGGRPNINQQAKQSLSTSKAISAQSIFEKLSIFEKQLKLSDRTSKEIFIFADKKESELSSTPSIWPYRGRISSSYGSRFHPVLGKIAFHDGIDMPGITGTPIIATADGVVIYSGNRSSYGVTVAIDHQGTSYETRYAHLVSTNVKVGQIVSRGDIVGFLGNTGRSTGPHLHYEIRKAGKSVNPLSYILDTQLVMD